MSLVLLLRRNNNLAMFFANVTQLAERQPSKLEVVGSNPIIRFFLYIPKKSVIILITTGVNWIRQGVEIDLCKGV